VARGESKGTRQIAPFADGNAAVAEGGGDGQDIAPCVVNGQNVGRPPPRSYHGSNG
jgi:hypothetical protein